jgi:hypothetical protein
MYFFAVRSYEPSINVKDAITQGPWRSPEASAAAHFGAMIRGEYLHWLDVWDETARVGIEERNKQLGRGAEFWVKSWRDVLGQYSTFVLKRRVDAGPFVIVELEATGPTSEPFTLDVTVKKGADGWRATQEGSDPVFLGWRKPGIVMEVVGREPPQID